MVVGGLHFFVRGRREIGLFCFVWQKNVGVYGNEVPLRHFLFGEWLAVFLRLELHERFSSGSSLPKI